MNRFYPALCAFLCLVSLFVSVAVPLQAQNQVTFSEDFNSVDGYGDLLDGWTAWQNSGGAYGAVWGASKDWPMSSDWYMYSPAEPGMAGMKDEDWLITPAITPQENDFFICKCFRGGAEEAADKFEFRVSTTTNTAPGAFTDVLASYTAAEMPYFSGNVSLDLSAYVGMPIYVAIVHIADTETDDPGVLSNYVIVDNVQVRPIQGAFVLDAVFRQATTPPRPPVLVTDPIVFAGSLGFIVAGDHGVANVSSVTLNTAGTTDLSIVKEIIVYYSDWNGISDDDILAGVYPVFGTVQNPGDVVTITGSQDLPMDREPMFWFRYILDETYQASYPFPQIDISVEKFTVNGVEQVPSVKTYFGAMDVVGADVSNDYFANAIELSATPARYGSSTMHATNEENYDAIAYCHNNGYPQNIHSVWWHFTAPSDGLVTADLSGSHFNTILAFFDENMQPVACNDDQSSSNQQSKIENYHILKGEKLYVRVSDIGAWGANQYDVSGVVVMDFAFAVPTGVPEDGGLSFVAMYPNPAAQNVSMDINVQRPSPVTIDVHDVMGRSRYTQQEQLTTAGRHTVTMDVSTLSPGTYVVRVQQGNRTEMRKLSIMK